MSQNQSITGVVETSAIKAGYCVKKGTAEQGVVIGTAGAKCLGISNSDGVIGEESFAVGEHISINIGDIQLAIAGATILSGQDLKSTSAGTLEPITDGGTSISAVQRVAIAYSNAMSGEQVKVKVKNDVV